MWRYCLAGLEGASESRWRPVDGNLRATDSVLASPQVACAREDGRADEGDDLEKPLATPEHPVVVRSEVEGGDLVGFVFRTDSTRTGSWLRRLS